MGFLFFGLKEFFCRNKFANVDGVSYQSWFHKLVNVTIHRERWRRVDFNQPGPMLGVYHDVKAKQLHTCLHIWHDRAVVNACEKNDAFNLDPHLLIAYASFPQVAAQLVECPFDAAALGATIILALTFSVFFSRQLVDGCIGQMGELIFELACVITVGTKAHDALSVNVKFQGLHLCNQHVHPEVPFGAPD